MSAINKALSELNQHHQTSTATIQKAEIPKSNRTPALVWVGVGFAMSIAMGGWAISQADDPEVVSALAQTEIKQTSDRSAPVNVAATTASPTASTDSSPVAVYALPKVSTKSEIKPVTTASAVTTENIPPAAVTTSAVTIVTAKNTATETETVVSQQPVVATEGTVAAPSPATSSSENNLNAISAAKPMLIAKVTHSDNSIGEMIIEQVELTPQELAQKAIARAKKSLDSNDIDAALAHYEDALRYTASNEQVRQQLAALYYGKGQTNKAYQLLEEGINRNVEGETLRIALTKLLIKEGQQEAALTPLVFLPSQASQEYLALRAGLAQRNKQTDLAYESYQLLTAKDRNNARWWMGLAIQQERKMEFAQAKDSYQKALSMIGISSQSKAFIRDRLQVIASLEGSSDAN